MECTRRRNDESLPRGARYRKEELKYILEAPKMEIGEDEKVQVPLLRDEYSGGYRDRWSATGTARTGERTQEPLENKYGDNFVPNVRLPQNPLITVAGVTIAAGIAVYSATLVR